MTDGHKAHMGSSLDDWLDEKGLLEEATSFAIKEVIAFQISEEMKAKHISKSRMAELMQTSRSQVDRLLDPENNSATLETLMRAARVLGRDLRLELV